MRTILAVLPLMLLLSACPPDAPGDDGGDPPVDVALGAVVLEQGRAPFWQARAFFAEPVASELCTVEEVAGCTFFTCEEEVEQPEDPASLDAGAVTVESEAKTVTLVRDGEGHYGSERVDGEEFFENGGELFAEATGGDDIEGFTLTLRAPTPLQMVTPPLASVTVKVTEALPLEWSNVSQGDVRVIIGDNTGRLGATCIAPSAGGGFAIPAEVIGRFPVGEGSMSVTGQVVATANLANARHVSFHAQTPATSAVGVDANYFVTFAAP
jgi:hypothetical protein